MLKVFSEKGVAIGNFDVLHYHNEAKGIVGVAPSGAAVNVVSCKRPEASAVLRGIYNQIGKKEGIMEIDSMVPQAPSTPMANGNGNGGMK